MLHIFHFGVHPEKECYKAALWMLGFDRGEKVTGTEAPLEQGVLSISSSAVRDQLERVLSADGFKRSPRMAGFLRFVVSETLAGNADRLKEYVIAVDVFGRDTSFDPNTSAVVRVEASRLRHRLQEYFLGPGRDDPIEIALPPGSYVPSFKTRSRHEDLGPASKTPLALPDKPSIAVLPFTNIGDDIEQGYFADGIVEDLITALSRINWLFVTARSSTFTYKGRAVDVRQVGSEMGVGYVVEGSVRRAGGRIRVSAQLIDATTGNHLWARHLDRDMGEIFALQDEITDMIAGTIEPELGAAERERAVRRPPESLEAWGLYQRGLDHMYRFTAEDNQEAQRLLGLAAVADPRFAAPLGAQAYVLFIDFILGFADDPDQVRGEAVAAGRAGVARDGKDPMARFGLGRALNLTGDIESALSELTTALELNPNFALAHLGVGVSLLIARRPYEAIEALDIAIRLSPHDPILWTMEAARARAYIEIGDDEHAVSDAWRACRHPNTSFWAYLTLVSALANLGRDAEVETARAALFELWPEFSMSTFANIDPLPPAATRRWREGLHKAGFDYPTTTEPGGYA
jgi:adenylate cyclase